MSKVITMFGLVFIPYIVVAEIVIQQLDIVQPRGFGYQIGDKFARSIQLQLRKPFRLDLDSLPAKGRLTLWLAVEEPQIVEEFLADTTQYHIRLTYQVINIDPDIQDIPVPHHDLLVSDGDETLKALITATRIRVSVLSDQTRETLQADRKPMLLSQRYVEIALIAALFLCSLFGLAYLHWGLPLISQKHPFGEVYRDLKKRRRQPMDDNRYREALRSIHQAFNKTAGKTVFTDELDDFLNKHSQFAPLQIRINEFFLHSREYFFDGVPGQKTSAYSSKEFEDFVRECHDIERGLQ